MKYTLSFLFFVSFSLHSFAQDRMVLPDGTSKNVFILNSDGDSLHYEMDGVGYSFPKKEVMVVVYQDGRTEMFNQY